MKKIFPTLLLVVFLSSCANLSDLAALLISPTPVPVDTATPRPTVTLIPTKDLFAVSTSTPVTFTPTEKPLIEVATLTPPPTFTLVPLPTFSSEFINDLSSTTFFVKNAGFVSISYSAAVLFWNPGPCLTRRIKLTAFVEEPERTDRVFLFLRLRDKTDTLNVGEWSAGAEMIKIEDGSFNYNIETDNLRRYWYYKNAWIEYQLVSVNEKLEILGRTQLYDHNISLSKCGQ